MDSEEIECFEIVIERMQSKERDETENGCNKSCDLYLYEGKGRGKWNRIS